MRSAAERRVSHKEPGDSRHRGREAALQMLYQWEVGRTSIDDVSRTFWSSGTAGEPPSEQVRAFAATLAHGVAAQTAQIDPLIAEAAEHWRLERMNVMDRLILRLAVYELLHEGDTPAKVVINEALELARGFSAEESTRFINGVLDAIRRTLGRE
jgi:N utilization substance protein B